MICAAFAAAASGADWATFRGGFARCGTTGGTPVPPTPVPPTPVPPTPVPPTPVPPPAARLLWRFREEKLLDRHPFASSPAIAGDRVVIGGDSYRVYCLDLATGKPLWRFEAKWPVFSSPAIADGRVYVGEGLHDNTDCKLYCLNLKDGKELWSIQTRSHTESSPTVVGGKVYFGAGDDGLYCADALTGKLLWQHKGPHEDGCPLVVEGRVYIGSGYGFQGVVCVDAKDGSPVWKKELPAPAWSGLSYAGGRLYVPVGKGTFTESAKPPYGEVRCLNPKNGEDIWRFRDVKDAVLTAVAVSGERAVFGSRDGACYALDAPTGKLLWRTDVGSPILSSPAVVGDAVLFGDDDGKLTCLRLKDGAKLWAVDTSDDATVVSPDPRILSSPAVVDGRVIFGSSNGMVYCFGKSGE
ncbi:MAG: hypothetical protein FJ291_29225 [Planctomycetes bacterium]|nr:hypothetical protein [Planctomycetota bacterium]